MRGSDSAVLFYSLQGYDSLEFASDLNMHSMIPAAFLLFEFSRTAFSMTTAGIVVCLIGLWAVHKDLSAASGLDKVALLCTVCFAMPLGVFGALHFSAAKGLSTMVPSFMPWPLFWTYLVGCGLISASLSIATNILVRWSGLMFGFMMFTFVATMDVPGAIGSPHDRFAWTLLLRELSFGCGGWLLAAAAIGASRGYASGLVTIGRVVLAITAIFYGVEHFLHPLAMPGVPLEKQMPAWIPGRMLIDYLTGAFLIAGGVCFWIPRKTRTAATLLGGWIVLVILVVYTPVLVTSLLNPSTDVKIEGLNYFYDTLLFGGTVLALARAMTAVERSVTGSVPLRG